MDQHDPFPDGILIQHVGDILQKQISARPAQPETLGDLTHAHIVDKDFSSSNQETASQLQFDVQGRY